MVEQAVAETAPGERPASSQEQLLVALQELPMAFLLAPRISTLALVLVFAQARPPEQALLQVGLRSGSRDPLWQTCS
jgi:hypothetical protein